MDSSPPTPNGSSTFNSVAELPSQTTVAQRIKGRILGGLLLLMPILITIWVFHWLYSTLATKVIDPLALLVIWKVRQGQTEAELPEWFEDFAAPLIAIILVLVLLYFLGFFVHSRLRRALDWVLLRVPLISGVYDGVRNVFQSLERKRGKQSAQRVVLIPFPHHGMRAAAFVTATCRDIATQKTAAGRVRAAIAAADQRAFAAGAGRGGDRIELGARPDVANADFRRNHGAA